MIENELFWGVGFSKRRAASVKGRSLAPFAISANLLSLDLDASATGERRVNYLNIARLADSNVFCAYLFASFGFLKGLRAARRADSSLIICAS